MAMAAIVKLVLIMSTRFWVASADESGSNELSDPLGKVSELLTSLKLKIIKEGEGEAKAFEEFFDWCHSTRNNLNYEIKNFAKIKEKQEAKVAELASHIENAVSQIEETSVAISTSESEIKAATRIRAKEQSDFAAVEKELIDASDTLNRAISIISAEMAKNPAALAQIDMASIASVLLSLGNVVDAAGVSSSDRQTLLAFVQSRQGEQGEVDAPTGPAHQSQSGDIVQLLENLNDKAQEELAAARKAETNSKHNFNMMKQSLEDQMAADTKDLNLQKSAKADAEDEKARTEGDLAMTMPHLEENKKSLEHFTSYCMQGAADHEATNSARTEELKVLSKAMEILKEETAGAGEISRAIFNKYSFLQTASMAKSTMQTRADLANTEVVAMLKKLAREQHSATLTQLASQISVMVKYGGRDDSDPFKKIKGLISEMIVKLNTAAEAEATEKDYCDKQMSTTEAKKEELELDHSKLVNSIDKAVAHKTQVQEDIALLFEEVSLLAAALVDLHKIRSSDHANYVQAKADLEGGMAGVAKVSDILKQYYGTSAALMQDGSQSPAFLEQPAAPQHHAKSSGAGGAIIDILEVVVSDFAATLTKEEAQEADAQSDFDAKTDNKRELESDLKYKKQEKLTLDKQISELANDQETLGSELSAVLQYYAQVRGRCVAKPNSYEDRKARKEAEIQGLKEALSILESEESFLQRKRRIRGGRNIA